MAIGENVRFHTKGLARNALRRKQAAFDLRTNSFDYNTGSSLRLRHLPSEPCNYTTKRNLNGPAARPTVPRAKVPGPRGPLHSSERKADRGLRPPGGAGAVDGAEGRVDLVAVGVELGG